MSLIRIWLGRLYNAPYILVLFAPLFWAGNIVLGRGVSQIIPPIGLAFWRWAIAFLILIPFSWSHLRKDWPVIQRHWKILLLLSFLGVTCFNTMLYKAVHTTTAINGSLIQSSMPAWIVLFSLLIFGERISRVQLAGMLLCIFGALYLVSRGDWLAISDLIFVEGDVWMIVAVSLYACYSAMLRKRPAMTDLGFLTATFAMGGLMLLPLYIWEVSVTPPLALSWQVGGSILYVAVFPSILAYLCWNRGAELIGANRTGLYINFVPVFASILAVILLDEILVAFHFVGISMIIGGMILFNRRTRA
jgi:drug/metabolite transporter (DMT)-like permease